MATVGLQYLIILFERFGIRKNAVKVVTMVFQPSPISGKHPAAAYEQIMTGEGDPHRSRKCQRVMYR